MEINLRFGWYISVEGVYQYYPFPTVFNPDTSAYSRYEPRFCNYRASFNYCGLSPSCWTFERNKFSSGHSLGFNTIEECFDYVERLFLEHHPESVTKPPVKQYKRVDWTGEELNQELTDLFDHLCPVCFNPLRNYAALKAHLVAGRPSVYCVSGRPSIYCSDKCKMKAYRKRAKASRISASQNAAKVSVKAHTITSAFCRHSELFSVADLKGQVA